MNLIGNYKRFNQVVNFYNANPRYCYLDIELRKSKTTNSLYLSVTSSLNDIPSKRSIRFSDHRSRSKIKNGKSLNKKITKEEIKRVIDKMIHSINKDRLRILLN